MIWAVGATLRGAIEDTAQQLVKQSERFLPSVDLAIERAKRRVTDKEVCRPKFRMKPFRFRGAWLPSNLHPVV